MLLRGMIAMSKVSDYTDRSGKLVQQVSFGLYDETAGNCECACVPSLVLPKAGTNVEATVVRASRFGNAVKFSVTAIRVLDGLGPEVGLPRFEAPPEQKRR